MAKVTIQELRGMAEAELRQRLANVQEELTTSRLKIRQGSGDHPHRIRQMRQEIARLLTILAERHQSARQTRASKATSRPSPVSVQTEPQKVGT